MDHGPTTPVNEDTPPAGTPTGLSQNPTSPESSAAARKEKGRVRFNSRADVEPSYFSHSGLSATSPTIPPQTITQPKPSLLRGNSYNSVLAPHNDMDADEDPHSEQARSAHAAQERAQHVAATLTGSRSAPNSQRTSIDSDANSQSCLQPDGAIPLADLNNRLSGLGYDGIAETPPAEDHGLNEEAYNLVRTHTLRHGQVSPANSLAKPHDSGQITPIADRDAELYVPPPPHYRGGVLSTLLKLYNNGDPPPSYPHSGVTTPGSSGTTTPNRKKWYDKNRSTDTLANLVEASARLASVSGGSASSPLSAEGTRPKRPKHKRANSNKLRQFGRKDEEIRITMHIAETLSRQKYIIKMCKALMMYGAPTHRLEEYLRMTARVLEIQGQFLYLPGCMIISFDDQDTHTAEVKIVRTDQGINLGKLKDIHNVYKSVLHDLYSVEKATEELNAIADKKELNPWLRAILFGAASASVGPFAFGAQWIDLPLCGVLGFLVGALQIIVAPKSPLYNNVFEISAAVFTSFLSRALGSINGGNLFCFSAMAQSSIALILPGWFVLSAALELQSRSLVPGSIRLVYAVIYSLFLGFGITVGISLYGLIDGQATSATTCPNSMNPHVAFLFVPLFTVFLALVNQAKLSQLPVMVVISFAGFVVNFFSSPKFAACPQIANTLGAFTVGVLANLYSRLRHGVAAAALLPAIFVQVPSGLAATGSLLSGLSAANQISNSDGSINGTDTVPVGQGDNLSNIVYNVAGSMIQIAIGITLGLFLSSLLIYPFGKRRSGLWTL